MDTRKNEEQTPLRRPAFRLLLGRFALGSFLLLLLLELFVFNYQSYALVGKGYEEKTFSMADAATSGLKRDATQENTFIATSGTQVIEFTGIGQPVGTLRLDLSFPQQKKARSLLDVSLAYTDTARSGYTNVPGSIRIVPDATRSYYEIGSFSGDVGSIKLTMKLDKNEIIQISGLTVNDAVPFHFSVVRILTLLCAAVVLYFLLKCPSMQLAYRQDNQLHRRMFWCTTGGMLALFLIVYFLYIGNPLYYQDRAILDQMTKELVDAFRAGQVSLLSKPSDELLALGNPYDRASRAGISYPWDHLLYDGKFYSYYGIAPVLLFYLPYNLLTGSYFPSMMSCLLFALGGAILLSLCYRTIVRNWFKNTPCNLVLAGQVILLASSGVLFCINRPKFYEAAEAAGFLFFTAGLLCMLTSGVFTEKRIRLSRLALSGVFTSLAVLSRPTFALYAVIMLIMSWYAWRQYRAQYEQKSARRSAFLRLGAAVLVPYAVFGGIQMAYNAMRFGSPLDFGIQYSLTINDFTSSQLHTGFTWVSLWNFLFQPPAFTSQFPFLTGTQEMWGVSGYYFFDFPTVKMVCGLLWRALPLCALLYAPHALRRMTKESRRKALLIGGAGILVPIIILLSTWESGHAMRYNIDFAWQLLLIAFAVIFFIYNRMRDTRMKQFFSRILIGCMALSVAANLLTTAMVIPGVTNTIYGYPAVTSLYYKLAMLFQFWW